MWERQRDPNHKPVGPTTKVFPEHRPTGTEGLCWAVWAGSIEAATAAGHAPTPCSKPAHHLGRHSWEGPGAPPTER